LAGQRSKNKKMWAKKNMKEWESRTMMREKERTSFLVPLVESEGDHHFHQLYQLLRILFYAVSC
jgi:hypothetical protein